MLVFIDLFKSSLFSHALVYREILADCSLVFSQFLKTGESAGMWSLNAGEVLLNILLVIIILKTPAN